MNNRRKKKRNQRLNNLDAAFKQVEELNLVESNDITNWNDVVNEFNCSNQWNGKSIEWEKLPRALDPFLGSELTLLSADRATRKRQQIESLLNYVFPLIQPGDTICDFGAGAGHIGLLIAYYFPCCRVILIEHNPEKHKMINSRVEDLAVTNNIHCKVEIFYTIDDFEKTNRTIDIGVSLHSCGLLSDETLKYCVRAQAHYVLVPCCYGQIAGKPEALLSERFRELSETNLQTIVSAADYTVSASNATFDQTDQFKVAKKAMRLVDKNRQLYAENFQYKTFITSLLPLNCSPKNNVVIGISPFHISSIHDVNLQGKIDKIKTSFSGYLQPKLQGNVEIIPSPCKNYRLRCRFGVTLQDNKFHYFVYEHGEKQIISEFDIASNGIQRIMPILADHLASYDELANGMQAIHFLHSLNGELVVTFIYDREIHEADWKEQLHQLKTQLFNHFLAISFIGRSKNQQIICGNNFVIEKLRLFNGRDLIYRQFEGSFSNPNGRINERCLDWLCRVSEETISPFFTPAENHLLELYCGCGNHTVALAHYYNKITAVELDSQLVDVAKLNSSENKIDNVEFLLLHSHNFCKKFLRNQKFNIILVDPPRSGLDPITLDAVCKVPIILYISCNPSALLDNFATISLTHTIVQFAIFDQFAYTSHCEIGVCAIENNILSNQ